MRIIEVKKKMNSIIEIMIGLEGEKEDEIERKRNIREKVKDKLDKEKILVRIVE